MMEISRTFKMIAAAALLAVCSLSVVGAMAQGEPQDGPPQGPPPDGQGGGRHMPGPDRQLNMLTRVLKLNPDQQKGVKAILEQQATEMKALREKAPADPTTGQTAETREARMTQMKQIREENDAKIAALLDDGQKKTFADWQQRREAQMESRRGRDGQGEPPPDGAGGPPPPPPNE